MNVRDYISSKFQSFGIQVSEADLLDMSLNARMSWNPQGLKDYYSLLCKKYGLKDELNDNKPKISFL